MQTIVDGLKKRIIGRRVEGVWFGAPRMIKQPTKRKFAKEIKGLVIDDIRRRGKYILIYLAKLEIDVRKNISDKFAKILLIHPKMTGHLLYGKWSIKKLKKEYEVLSNLKGEFNERVNGHIRFILYLDNGWQVGLSDQRKFAVIRFGEKEKIENIKGLKELGPDALGPELTPLVLQGLLKKKRAIKPVLMDQKVLAGLGNIYSSEALFLAGIHPERRAETLKKEEIKGLLRAIRVVLRRGLALGGTSIINFRDPEGRAGRYAKKRLIYGRANEGCKHCGEEIKKVTIGGRSSWYCPNCQK